MDPCRYRYGTVKILIGSSRRKSPDATFVPFTPQLMDKKNRLCCELLDASVVYTYLTLNVGPPLGLIKYKIERKARDKNVQTVNKEL